MLEVSNLPYRALAEKKQEALYVVTVPPVLLDWMETKVTLISNSLSILITLQPDGMFALAFHMEQPYGKYETVVSRIEHSK